MSPLIRNLAFALVLALILWFGYVLFIRESSDAVTADTSLSVAAQEGQEFLATLQRVREIELQGEVLNDARFESLVDISQDVVPEPYGRHNPFLPVTEER